MNKPATNDITFGDFIKATEKLVISPPKQTKWLSPADTCDICHTDLPTKVYFVDGRTKRGPWALMCPACHHRYGVGLGTGFGQKYDSKTRIKIAG